MNSSGDTINSELEKVYLRIKAIEFCLKGGDTISLEDIVDFLPIYRNRGTEFLEAMLISLENQKTALIQKKQFPSIIGSFLLYF